MSIIDALARFWKRDAVHYVVATIPPARQDVPVADTSLLAEQHYLRVWVSEMFLKEDGRLFRDYVPVVHSSVRLQFGDRPAQELPYVAGPHNLGLESTIGKGVQLNHPLTNLLPFRGGTVGIAAALVAYKERDFFQGFISVLSDVSGLLNVGQLSTTLKVVDTAVDGIQNLLGGGDKSIHLLFYQGFGGTTASGGSSLKSGYTAIIRANAKTFDETKLWVKERRLTFGSSLAGAKPLEGYDYMLLRTEAALRRDDYLAFDSIAKLLQDAIREGHRDRPSGDALIKTIQVMVWDSPDFTTTDRLAVAKGVQEEYRRALGSEPPPPSPLTPAPPHPDEPPPPSPLTGRLESLNRAITSISLPPSTENLLVRPSLQDFMKALE